MGAGVRMPTADEPAVLVCGDALDVLRGMPTGCIDLVLTDPPYNVGCQYLTYDDERPDDEYEAWCRSWFAECQRVAKRTVIFPGHGNIGMWHRIERPRGIGCWYKPGNPAGGGVFQFCEWEPWLLYGCGLRVVLSDTIRATVSNQQDVGDHPCPKPVSLMRGVLERVKGAKTVLDPLMGSGTSGVACVQMGRRFVGVELDPHYFTTAQRRINEALGVGSLFPSAPAAVADLYGEPSA